MGCQMWSLEVTLRPSPQAILLFKPLGHRWQTGGPQAESGPPPCFILPGTLFVPRSSLPLVREKLHLYSPTITFGGNHQADVAPCENEFDTLL